MHPTRRSLLSFGRPAPVAIADCCLARSFVHCQSCGDACPAQAIRFTPRLGGPPLPRITASLCTGCGDCVPVCPVGALALTVEAAHG
ncbi:MAG: 4Fe-4S dicluster domain-containing protein [Acetobacteraceae bacterium]